MTEQASQLFSCRAPTEVCREAKLARDCAADAVTIDIHCHAHIPAADAMLAQSFDPELEPMIRFATNETRATNRAQMAGLQPKLTEPKRRLEDMDRLGIQIQAISPSPFQYFYWAEADAGRAAARTVNDGIAAIVAAAPERFLGFGTVPLQDPGLAIEELDRMVKELGFRGVQLATNVCGRELSDPAYRRFLARVEELGLLIFLHPNGFTHAERLSRHYLINTIGNPLDTGVAAAHLILDGVLDEFPALKICLAHGGGYLPASADRIDHAYSCRADSRGSTRDLPSAKLKTLYYDTVVFSHAHLEYLIKRYGADRFLMGSDYPYDMGEPDPVKFIAGCKNISKSDRRKILGLNASSLLGINFAAVASSSP
jgi:aminocarboxymuconate-semialdehyde decarboxylase